MNQNINNYIYIQIADLNSFVYIFLMSLYVLLDFMFLASNVYSLH